jgi:3-oxoacyl-[acyl-carrier-protein] synthase II
MRRVVVTGLGAVTPLGNNVEETWEGIKAGRSGLGNITLFDTSNTNVKVAAEVKNWDTTEFVDKKDARKMARFTQFAVVAAGQALKDAGLLEEGALEPSNTGVFVGNGIGGFEVFEESCGKYFSSEGKRVPPLTIPMLIPNEAAGNICMRYGIKGPAPTIATACASGSDALGLALDSVRSGRVDVCVAGGTEATITGFGIASFAILQTLASSFNDCPQKASRPFDKAREGFVMGEGSAMLILEEYEHAKKRGAKIYAEFAGYGASSDAYHITSPDPSGDGGAAAMVAALKDAGVKPEEAQYYNAHGTSTSANDTAETVLLKSFFGEHAYKLKISSTKSETGHMVGAAGSMEAIFCIKAIEEGFVPPTINLDNPDLEHGCDLDYTPNVGVKMDVNVACSCSLGFGGHNGCIIFKKI